MTKIFVDTGAWISLLSERDEFHEIIVRHFRRINLESGQLVTTSAILTEVLDGLSNHKVRYLSVKFHRHLENAARLEIVHIDQALFQRGWNFYEARTDKDWSLTDCLSFVVMQGRSMSEALAHDHHFAQAGFRALLRDAEYS